MIYVAPYFSHTCDLEATEPLHYFPNCNAVTFSRQFYSSSAWVVSSSNDMSNYRNLPSVSIRRIKHIPEGALFDRAPGERKSLSS